MIVSHLRTTWSERLEPAIQARYEKVKDHVHDHRYFYRTLAAGTAVSGFLLAACTASATGCPIRIGLHSATSDVSTVFWGVISSTREALPALCLVGSGVILWHLTGERQR